MRFYIAIFLMIFIVRFAHADGECANGYTLTSTDLLPTRAGACDITYMPFATLSDVLYPVARDLPIKCDEGYYYKNGTCVAYTTGACDTGFFDETPAVSATTFDQPYAGACQPWMQTMLGRPHAAYVMASTVARCGTGYYPTPNGCVAHTTDDCPTNYYAPTPMTAFVRGNTTNECPTNYTLYDDTDLCLRYLGAGMAKVCTPQLRCASTATTLHTSTGIVLPLYREKVTQPSLHIGFENGDICYVNVISGQASGAINMEYSGAVYHCVE